MEEQRDERMMVKRKMDKWMDTLKNEGMGG